ncbi:MAG: prepilin-type N-terminal cleavage/methylation domain-containing protein [Elusimicrobiaceae bacterium]|nr:prepilin-type N-terminal cleavage/methylation domain-containing protein [Elusimicrobiaceae bacterium]
MKKGFTLIELLIVVLIIGVLSAVALPIYNRVVEKTRATEAMQTLSSIATGEQSFQMANSGFTDQFETLDLSFNNYSDGSQATGNTLNGQYFDYTIYGNDKKAALAKRNNGEYELSVDYMTKEIFCRPIDHYICSLLDLQEGQSFSKYDTSNLQNWVMDDYVGYIAEELVDKWNQSCGNDLHCLQDTLDHVCTSDGKCLNKMGASNAIIGADGNKYYWEVAHDKLTLYVNDYAARPFFAQIFFYVSGSDNIVLRGNVNHNGQRVSDSCNQVNGYYYRNGDWTWCRVNNN